MALHRVDFAVAIDAAWRQRRDGSWGSAAVGEDLGLETSAVERSVSRLRDAGILRDQRLLLVALAEILPVLRYLAPLVVDRSRKTLGIPTGFAAPVFEGHIRYVVPEVWATANGTVVGHPVKPLHARLPEAVRDDPERASLFALVDAVRGGRAREAAYARGRLWELLGLPAARTVDA